jgi:two-component system response regulator NreC
MSRPIRILIADDHAVVRSGLRLLLSSQADMEVVADCGSHREVLEALETSGGIDVASLDLTMPGGAPAALIEDVIERCPGIGVVVLTMHDDPGHARMALAAGARGYVVKSAADRQLLEAIRSVARGGTHLPEAVGGEPVTGPKPSGPVGGRPRDSLSQREREVLVLLAQGHTNQQIADKLYLSVKTIESYRSRLMGKLGLANRAELTRFALEAGLLGSR